MLDKILFFLLVIFQLSDDTNALQECYNGTQFGVCYDGWYCCGKHGYCCQKGFICRKSQCIQRESKCAYITLMSLASFILLVIFIFFEIVDACRRRSSRSQCRSKDSIAFGSREEIL